MGNLALVRVDARLIHGQIAAKWTKVLNISTIVVIDDETAGDAFMRRFFEMAGVPGVKTQIHTIDQAVDAWRKNQFAPGEILVIFKSVEMAKRAYDAGFNFPSLDLGQVPGGTLNRVKIIGSVNLNEQEIRTLRDLKAKGVNVFFQSIPEPEDKPQELDIVLKKNNL